MRAKGLLDAYLPAAAVRRVAATAAAATAASGRLEQAVALCVAYCACREWRVMCEHRCDISGDRQHVLELLRLVIASAVRVHTDMFVCSDALARTILSTDAPTASSGALSEASAVTLAWSVYARYSPSDYASVGDLGVVNTFEQVRAVVVHVCSRFASCHVQMLRLVEFFDLYRTARYSDALRALEQLEVEHVRVGLVNVCITH
jgi:hypothetical protein